ncbi:MAG: M20/M25/M40 family metallo-hydrolase [Eubacteriales bacterium]|nr:M20/M25/M40 family metallo-hydrolase [Eubacteriales bacterium]
MRYKEEIHNYVQEHTREIIDTLKELVRIPSVRGEAEERAPFGKECARILKHIRDLYDKNGFETELDADGGYLLSYFGKGEKSLGLFAHADVVRVDNDWIYTNPFAPIEKEGYIIGRGAWDDKAAVVISLYCAKMLNELDIPFDSKLVMFTGSNEETGMEDMANYLKAHIPPDFSLVCDSGFPMYCGDKSNIQFVASSNVLLKDITEFCGGNDFNISLGKASAKIGEETVMENGISRHGALPEGSVNAGYLLSKKLSNMSELCESDRKQMEFVSEVLERYYGEIFGIECEDECFGKLTCTNGIIKTENGKVSLCFDLRYPYGLDANEIKRKIEEFFEKNDWNVEVVSEREGYIISKDDEYVKACIGAFNEFFGEENSNAYYNAGATYARELPHSAEIGVTLYGGSPEGTPDGHGNVHQSDECLNIEGMLLALEVTMQMLIRCDEMNRK